jgi:hypothetical protein
MADLPGCELGRTGLQVTMLGYGAMELRSALRARDIMPSRSSARRWVGVARMAVRRSRPRRTTLRVSVARSPSRCGSCAPPGAFALCRVRAPQVRARPSPPARCAAPRGRPARARRTAWPAGGRRSGPAPDHVSVAAPGAAASVRCPRPRARRAGHRAPHCARRAGHRAPHCARRAADARGGPARQVGEGSVLGLAGLAVTLPQQDGGRRASVGDDSHIHALTRSLPATACRPKSGNLHDRSSGQYQVLSAA